MLHVILSASLPLPTGAPLGASIILEKILAVGGRDFTLLGRPLLPPGLVRVEVTVVEKTLSRTKIVQTFRKRENYRKIRFERERWTLLRIGDIKVQKPVD